MIVSLIWHQPNMATPAYDSERYGDKRCKGRTMSWRETTLSVGEKGIVQELEGDEGERRGVGDGV